MESWQPSRPICWPCAAAPSEMGGARVEALENNRSATPLPKLQRPSIETHHLPGVPHKQPRLQPGTANPPVKRPLQRQPLPLPLASSNCRSAQGHREPQLGTKVDPDYCDNRYIGELHLKAQLLRGLAKPVPASTNTKTSATSKYRAVLLSCSL
jgi:hypothetical protein